jgi:tartrate dehydratase beta subunit/fumarate hydratase class I family protein
MRTHAFKLYKWRELKAGNNVLFSGHIGVLNAHIRAMRELERREGEKKAMDSGLLYTLHATFCYWELFVLRSDSAF